MLHEDARCFGRFLDCHQTCSRSTHHLQILHPLIAAEVRMPLQSSTKNNYVYSLICGVIVEVTFARFHSQSQLTSSDLFTRTL